MRNNRFYNHAKHGAQATIDKRLADGTITPDDIGLIKQFVAHKKATKRHISEARERQVIVALVLWRRFIKTEYRNVTADVFFEAMSSFKSATSEKGTPYSQNTSHDYVATLKGFMLWLAKKKIIDVSTDDIREVETPSVDTDTTMPEELLNTDDVLALLQAEHSAKHKAFIALSYESACRPEEVCNLQWNDLVPDEYGMKMYITDTKTGKRRYARLTMSAPYVSEWRKESGGDKATGFVFTGRGKQKLLPMTWNGATSLLYKAGRKAGLNKKLKLYLMRKSRITQMVRDGYPEGAIRATAWNNQGTAMLKTYVKLSEKDIDAMILDAAGVVRREASIDVRLAPIVCSHCHESNGADKDYCARCGMPISAKAIQDAKDAKEKEEQDRKALERDLMEKIFASSPSKKSISTMADIFAMLAKSQ